MSQKLWKDIEEPCLQADRWKEPAWKPHTVWLKLCSEEDKFIERIKSSNPKPDEIEEIKENFRALIGRLFRHGNADDILNLFKPA